jgi:hypothetical protein
VQAAENRTTWIRRHATSAQFDSSPREHGFGPRRPPTDAQSDGGVGDRSPPPLPGGRAGTRPGCIGASFGGTTYDQHQTSLVTTPTVMSDLPAAPTAPTNASVTLTTTACARVGDPATMKDQRSAERIREKNPLSLRGGCPRQGDFLSGQMNMSPSRCSRCWRTSLSGS